jgi:hypothetical protein
MQRAAQIAIFLLAIVLTFCMCTEKYTMLNRNYDHSLDTAFSVHRLSNDRKQTKDPFNTCSPESYEDCAKNAMPHLSRY